MNKEQADAVAHAVLAPGLKAHEEIRQKKIAEAQLLARKRRVAWFSLAGFGIGVLIALFTGNRFTLGGICGGLGGSVAGWLLTRHAA